jgi:predicted transporter
MELLWKLGILSIVMVFGIKIGLAMGFAGLSKKITAAIILGYGGGILLLTYIAGGFVEQLQGFVYDYSSVLGIAMAAIILYAGFHTLKEWKIHSKDNIASPMIGVSAFVVGEYAAAFLMITMTVCYLVSGYIGRALNKPYPVLLGNFMLFAGFYFLTSAIVIPNISTVLSHQMSPINIPDIWTFSYALLTVAALVVVGYYITRKRSPFVNQTSGTNQK